LTVVEKLTNLSIFGASDTGNEGFLPVASGIFDTQYHEKIPVREF
jgi:hypothetical protein